MIGWIMWGTLLILWISGLFIMSFIIDKRRRMIFGVTVPLERMKDAEVIKVTKRYQKKKKIFNYLGFVLTFPTIFMGSFVWIYSYFNFYLLILFGVLYGMIYKGNREMKGLKKEQGWNVGERGAVYVDTKLTKEAQSYKQPSIYWLFPALILSFEPLLARHPMLESTAWVMIGTSLFIWTIALLAYIKIKKSSPKVYSGKTNIDQRFNDMWKARWMTMILGLTYYGIIFNSVIHRLMTGSGGETGGVFIIIILVGSALPMIPLFWMHRVRGKMVEDLEKEERILEVDEDDYWIGGMFYNNPNVNKTFVSTRIGMGSTINLGTTAGKWTMGIALLFTFGAIFGSWGLVIAEEYVNPKILWDDDRFYIQSLGYSDEIMYNEIEEITVIEELGRRTRTNGSATDRYARGNFQVQDYGRSRVYVFLEIPKIIAIHLEEKTIFYNESTIEDTETTLNLLLQRVKK